MSDLNIYSTLESTPTPETDAEEAVEEQVHTPWKVVLYDDDVHTFDEVIAQIIKATGCSLAKAEELTWQVHNEGKAIVYEGDFEKCLQVDIVLKEIQLISEIKG